MGVRAETGSKGEARKIAQGRRAVFLDRDGTIIRQIELPHKPSQVRLLPGAAKAIASLKEKGYFLVIVSNQPVVARGMLTPAGVIQLNNCMLKNLATHGAKIDAFYFCPHHPKADVSAFRKTCSCRKPAPGMILDAAKRFKIDLKKSFLVGDTTQDILAGRNARVRTILVMTGHGGRDPWQYDAKPDFVTKNLTSAARIIKKLSDKS